MNGLLNFNVGRTLATIAAVTFLFLLGIVGGAAVGDIPTPIAAQAPGDDEDTHSGGGGGGGSTCEDDACVKIERWWWFDTYACKVAPDSGTGCNLTGGDPPCANYQCDD